MPSESDDLRNELRTLMAATPTYLPEYEDDPSIKLKLGAMIASATKKRQSRRQRTTGLNAH